MSSHLSQFGLIFHSADRSAFFEQQAMEAAMELEQEGRGVPVTGIEEDEVRGYTSHSAGPKFIW